MFTIILRLMLLIPGILNLRRMFHPGRRLVIVGMVDSSHFKKWVNELAQQDLFNSIWIFPSDSPKSDFGDGYRSKNVKISRFHFHLGSYFGWAAFKILDLTFGASWRSIMLARYIRCLRPDTIHFHELQHGAYLFNAVSKNLKHSAKVITSTWGSDILLYGQVESHVCHIQEVLSWTDVLTSERIDDFELAHSLGFKGEFVAPIYITLGSETVNSEMLQLPSLRNGIIIKGYQDVTGRALNILHALDLLGHSLSGYEIYIYSTEKSPAVRVQAEILQRKYGLKILLLEKMDHAKLMEFFLKSRIYVGMAISDGLSTSMVEAMAHGVFPIQSKNSAAAYFVKHGISGMVLDPWDIPNLAFAIKDSLSDGLRLDNAAKINAKKINSSYNLEIGISKMTQLYR